jgi:copper chaperone CopZ
MSAMKAMRGAGFVQVIIALLVIGIMTMIALKMFQRSPLPEVGPGAGDPRRAVMDRATIYLEGVETGIDAAQVEEAVRKIPGVASISIPSSNDRAEVTYNPQRTNPDQIIAAIERAGYRASD